MKIRRSSSWFRCTKFLKYTVTLPFFENLQIQSQNHPESRRSSRFSYKPIQLHRLKFFSIKIRDSEKCDLQVLNHSSLIRKSNHQTLRSSTSSLYTPKSPGNVHGRKSKSDEVGRIYWVQRLYPEASRWPTSDDRYSVWRCTREGQRETRIATKAEKVRRKESEQARGGQAEGKEAVYVILRGPLYRYESDRRYRRTTNNSPSTESVLI